MIHSEYRRGYEAGLKASSRRDARGKFIPRHLLRPDDEPLADQPPMWSEPSALAVVVVLVLLIGGAILLGWWRV